MKDNKDILAVVAIFVLAFFVRIFYLLPYNSVIGFDQARDLWDATVIFRDHNLRIVGPVAGNNLGLHHGVLYLYYLIFPLIVFRGDPMGAAIWNSVFNALTSVILYFFAKGLFKNREVSVISGLIGAFSYQLVSFSGWLSNPTPTIFTVPLFFFGLWSYYKGKNWGLPLTLLFLGLSIQLELFFAYLIPVFLIIFFLLRLRIPNLKLGFISLFLFFLSVLTMILTEFKFGFVGVKSILSAGEYVGGSKTSFLLNLSKFMSNIKGFQYNFWNDEKLAIIFTLIVFGFFAWEIFVNFKNKEIRDRDMFLVVFYLSPSVMLLLGYHNAPWFLIGRPAATILMGSYVISKVKPKFLMYIAVLFVLVINFLEINSDRGRGQVLLEPDESAIMSEQIKAIDYTYKESYGRAFLINTLTNPLYVNAVWSYQYYWYGKSHFGYLPSFGGGDQLYPYNSLEKEGGNEKYLYLLMDKSIRIPPQYTIELINWADKKSRLLDQRDFGGILVQKRQILKL